MEFKLPYIRTWTNFWILGMAYAFFCWSIFIAYCIYYQVSRLSIYRSRSRRINGKEDSSILEPHKFRLLHRLNHVVRIPYTTELISVKQIVGTILFGLINLYFIFFVYPYEFAPYHVAILDRRAAFIGMVDWSLVFFFAQRNSLLPKICGLTFEELMPFHRIFARIGFLTFIPHFIYRVYYAYMIKYSWFDAFFQDIEYTTGTIATIAYIVMFATSIEYIRRNHFEVFYYCHVLFLVVAIVFTCWHYPTCFAFYIPAVSLWIADRMVRFYKSWIIKSSFVSIQQVVAQTATQEGVVHISFQNKLLNRFKPGQYLFAAIVLNKRRFWEYLNWHPFTISEVYEASPEINKSEEHNICATKTTSETTGLLQSPQTSYLTSPSHLKQRRPSVCKDKIASIHIKSLGTKTNDLLNASSADNKMASELKVYIDGLYGPQLPYQDYPILALFATGIGVTPAIAIIQDVIRKRSNGVRTVASNNIRLYWSIRHTDEIDPFMNMFSQWNQQVQNAIMPVELNVNIYVTRMTQQRHSIQQFSNFHLNFNGRPQIDAEMRMIKANNTQGQRTWVHVCGSTAFTRTVINEAVKADFDIHHEIFEF
ncbi:Ferric reduction oxidase 7, chloroplastic [Choanephora cucurbitarum]|uniref:Ferric reduction oxidase 7, chloroplastic n=1 Tax=Choanephora cucurbitarum TaxID=101091 RepID=A0A1C7NAQ6_9FUNG|nr:Ferric reduction oxidase 7, chloroplastic [Choanephora cucurbitarum]